MLLFLDFETYYDREYSLRRMTPAEYILDPRFECICLGVAWNGDPPQLVDGPLVGDYLTSLQGEGGSYRHITTVTYNALFDNAILAWRYNFRPARMVDGMGMARALLSSRLRRVGLKEVAEHLGCGVKGDTLNEVIGLHRADIQRDKDLWNRFGTYCKTDTTILRKIFTRLHSEFPEEEYAVMDAVLRTCIEPVFRCDIQLLEEHLGKIRREKAQLCETVGVDKDAISGNSTFLQLLQETGVTVEYKQGKRGLIPATAKTDAFMTSLLEHEDPKIQCLAAARLGVKSTLEEKRSERLIAIASLPWPSGAMMPVPLRYSGAHTWRLSGDWKINLQNLPSSRMGDPILRKSLMAPPGHKIVVGDLAQIEARLVAWFCRDRTLLHEFQNKFDPYSGTASDIFGFLVDKTTLGGIARHIGKGAVLGCGYGMGPDKFYTTVLRQSRAQLTKSQLEQLKAIWTTDLAKKAVYAYRNRYSDVRSMWSTLDEILGGAWLGKREVDAYRLGVVTIGHRDGCGYVRGPAGREIRYPSPLLKDEELWWSNGGVPQKIYGANLLENIIQFLARIVMFEIAMRLKDDYGLRFIHQVHDELVFCVPDNDVEWALACLNLEMRLPPEWCPDLPLDCDVGAGQRYGDCK